MQTDQGRNLVPIAISSFAEVVSRHHRQKSKEPGSGSHAVSLTASCLHRWYRGTNGGKNGDRMRAVVLVAIVIPSNSRCVSFDDALAPGVWEGVCEILQAVPCITRHGMGSGSGRVSAIDLDLVSRLAGICEFHLGRAEPLDNADTKTGGIVWRLQRS